jgi:thiol-disulfide isomerase/thioredoxin
MWPKYRKLFWILMGTAALGVLLFGIKYLSDTSYEGNSSIRFIDERYNSLEDLLQAEPFRDKVLYVDFWFSTCGPCRREFKVLPRVKDYLKDQEKVEYLYISHRTRHPNADQLWKNAIREYNLTGWHYMMDRSIEKEFWKEMNAMDSTVRMGFPHYLIIDNTSGYRNYDAPKPSEFQSLKDEITPLLNP